MIRKLYICQLHLSNAKEIKEKERKRKSFRGLRDKSNLAPDIPKVSRKKTLFHA